MTEVQVENKAPNHRRGLCTLRKAHQLIGTLPLDICLTVGNQVITFQVWKRSAEVKAVIDDDNDDDDDDEF